MGSNKLLQHLGVNPDAFCIDSIKDHYIDKDNMKEDISTIYSWVMETFKNQELAIEVSYYISYYYHRRNFHVRFIWFTSEEIRTISDYFIRARDPEYPNDTSKYVFLSDKELIERVLTCMRIASDPRNFRAPSRESKLKKEKYDKGLIDYINGNISYNLSNSTALLLVSYIVMRMIINKTFPKKLYICRMFEKTEGVSEILNQELEKELEETKRSDYYESERFKDMPLTRASMYMMSSVIAVFLAVMIVVGVCVGLYSIFK